MDQLIINFIIEELHSGNKDLVIEPEDDLLGSGLIESLGMMRVIQFLETQFDFKVSPQDMTIENFMTVQAMVEYIEQVKK